MVTWNADPEIVRFGAVAIRWYSLAFIVGFLTGEKYCSKYLMEVQGFTKEQVSKLLHYMLLGCIIGARLGHCLFYEPSNYLSNPHEILFVWKGGLASHGGFVGVMIGIFLFNKRVKTVSFLWLLDLVAAPSLITGSYIRLGNYQRKPIEFRNCDC